MDDGAKVYLRGVYNGDSGDADGFAIIYYVFRDICGERVPEYYNCNTGVWAEFGGIHGGSDTGWNIVGRYGADGGGVGTWTEPVDDFYENCGTTGN